MKTEAVRKRIITITIIIGLLALLSACGGGGDGGIVGLLLNNNGNNNTTTNSTSNNNSSKVIASASIASSGGTIKYENAGDKLNGLQVDIPSGTYTNNTQINISVKQAPAVSQNGGVPLTQLIHIDDGGGYTKQPVSVKIPITSSNNDHFAMAFYYDEATGKYEGIPIKEYANDHVTISTTCLNYNTQVSASSANKSASLTSSGIVVIDFPKNLLSAKLNTGFTIKKDNWEFPNEGPFTNPDGICNGMSISSIWYYSEKKIKGEKDLYGLFDNDGNSSYKTPTIWQDDTLAYKFATVIQNDLIKDGWVRTLFDTLSNVSDDVAYYSLVSVIYFTGKPQLLCLGKGDKGHAVVAYKVENNTIYVYDPSFPDATDRTITFSNGKFDSYPSTSNTSDSNTINYDKIYYCSTKSFIDWNKIASRWNEVQNKTIGNSGINQLPSCSLQVLDNGNYIDLISNYTTKNNQVLMKIKTSASQDTSIQCVYKNDGTRVISIPENGIETIPLQPGNNLLGIYITANVSQSSGFDYRWLGFKWVNINSNPVTDSSIDKHTTSFDKNTSQQTDISITMAPNGNTLTSIKNVNYQLVLGNDYTVSLNTITIKKSYLSTLTSGQNTLTFAFTGGNPQSLIVTVSDTTPNNSTIISPTTASFDKNMLNQATDIPVTIIPNGNTLSSIKNVSYTLVSGTDYTITGNNITIKKTYLSTLALGQNTLAFTFTGGNPQSLIVTVSNNTPSNSTISPTRASFDKNVLNQNDISVTMTLNGNTLNTIKYGNYTLNAGSDYIISGSNVTLKKSYLSTFAPGTMTFVFSFNNGNAQNLILDVLDSTPVVQPATKTIPVGNGYNLEMVLIPNGSYVMGDGQSDRPKHNVTISKPFYLGKYEVTESQWYSVMKYYPPISNGGDNWPAGSISWNESQKFINELNKLNLGLFRLPTEAEWEYACRAGTDTTYYWGSIMNGSYCWYANNSNDNPIRVNSLQNNNKFGLFGMSGNVREWCNDYYGTYTNEIIDPQGPTTGTIRVARGGGFKSPESNCTSYYRQDIDPNNNNAINGFRVVFTEYQKVEAPTFSPVDGTSFATSQQVTISCATNGATIKYTTDGTAPSSTNGTAYSTAINVTATTTIKSIAIKSGMTDSNVSSATYTKMDQVAVPVFSPADGTLFAASQQVTISCATSGATIKYTTDGTAPSSTNGTAYSTAINVTATTTIKAIAIKSGMTDSNVPSATYTKIGQVATPSFVPTDGTSFATSQQVTISCATNGAAIKYTTDGTLPSLTNGATYTSAINLAATTTIKAIATINGMTDSVVSSATYTKMEQVIMPTLTPVAGTYTSAQSVTFNCVTSGATIKYTIDGSTPSSTNGITYITPINVTSTMTIKAIALKNGMADSTIASAVFTINIQNPSGQTLEVDLGGGVKLVMVKIHAGTFQMGSLDTEQNRLTDEGPVHQVTISKDYYMGIYEVTQGQWKAIMNGANPSYFKTGDDYPVERVSWNDITAASTGFLAKLNQLAPNGYNGFRLPTEAEWENAARAGTPTRFYWGNDFSYTLIGNYAWYSGNSGSATHPVGQKIPNTWGLYDMSGNVWEWCNDFYGTYPSNSVSDPVGSTSGTTRVGRGGCGNDGDGSFCRSAKRGYDFPSSSAPLFGFRLALPTDTATQGKVETPTFTPIAGTYTFTQSVTITSNTYGADIYYTTNGEVPSASSIKYTGAITVSTTATIKAIAIKSGMINSEIATASFTINQFTGQTIEVDLGGGVKLEMVKIPAGTFQMGSSSNEDDSVGDETPVHQVTISKDYYMGKYEVTQGQWKAIMGGANPSFFKLGDNYPVEQVSWSDISTATTGFLAKLNQLAPNGFNNFRLPTEAEWEYAVRARTQTRFYWGDNPLLIDNYEWYNTNSNGTTHPVGGKLPNTFGLYDMSGNVFEWCGDWYGSYGSSAVTDYAGPASGTDRVIRGSYYSDQYGNICRSTFRSYIYQDYKALSSGFRLALPSGQ